MGRTRRGPCSSGWAWPRRSRRRPGSRGSSSRTGSSASAEPRRTRSVPARSKRLTQHPRADDRAKQNARRIFHENFLDHLRLVLFCVLLQKKIISFFWSKDFCPKKKKIFFFGEKIFSPKKKKKKKKK